MNKCVNGKILPMTPEEIAEQERMAAEMPPVEPTLEDKVNALEEANAMLLEALLEMSEEVYS